jgi:hypothetical protein
MCKKTGTGEVPKKTYVACPRAPVATTGTNAAPAAVDTTMSHLWNCAVCGHTTAPAGTANTATNSMWCERCKPGFMEMMGGCYSMADGQDTPNTGLCKNCDACKRFSGNHGQLDYRCEKCK